ncbi:MAG: copper chaperone PCu(A)C [Pseudomonadales bacterium]
MDKYPLALKSIALSALLLLSACGVEPNNSAELATDTMETVTALGLSVKNPIVREPVAGRDITVAYLTIHNKGREDRVLLSASSAYANRIEIHEHQHSEGRMRMIKRSSLPIAANSDTALKSGGAHLMLFGLQPVYTIRADGDPPTQPQTVELTLQFDQGETLTVSTQLSSLLN